MREYIAAEALYLTQDGRVVGHSDPAKLRLLCAAGQPIPVAVAQQYGLAPDGTDPPTAIRAPRKAIAGPPHDKAHPGPARTKARLGGPDETSAHD